MQHAGDLPPSNPSEALLRLIEGNCWGRRLLSGPCAFEPTFGALRTQDHSHIRISFALRYFLLRKRVDSG